MEITWLQGTDLERLPAFVTALAIGLLIGLERERHPGAKAGLRTFALVALFGALAAFLSEHTDSALPLVAGLVLVGAMVIAAYVQQEETEPGTTTVAAVLVCYGLAAMVWYGYAQPAVMLAMVTVMLLYFKPELRGFTQGLDRRDLISVLQFGVLMFIVLPILPDRAYGPYDVLNPRELWIIVVLISGVSLAGYVALRAVGARHGAPLLGFFGGMVSSTATTLVYSRYGASKPALRNLAVIVIVLANMVLMLRLALLSGVIAPSLLASLLPVLGTGFAAGLLSLAYLYKRGGGVGEPPMPDIKNPTELRTALTFAVVYAVVLLLAAWLSDIAGSAGLYAVALASGLTDVDAITLSTLRLYLAERVSTEVALTAVVLAILANNAFKLGMVRVAGGSALFWRCGIGIASVSAGLVAALLLL